ncbi:MAG: hypothetical protein HY923_08200 [Elusimicrobia bacterium]|nr:hypothetical protein [Elusimicrobiota bacterium]
MRFLLAGLLTFAATRANPDCGAPSFVIAGGKIPAKILSRAIGVIEFTGQPDEDSQNLHIYHDRAGTAEGELSTVQAGPVSFMPTCRERKGFDGNMFIVTETWEGAIRFVSDWSTGREVWYRPGGGVYDHRLWLFSDEKLADFGAVDIFFRRDKVALYDSPAADASKTFLQAVPSEWPRQRSAYRVLDRRDGFIQIGEDERAAGWVRWRDEDGILAVWPAYRGENLTAAVP